MPAKINFRNHWLARYGLVLMVVLAAFLLRAGLERMTGGRLPAYLTFYPAVMLSALLGGVGPGLLSTVTLALGANYFILPPLGSFSVATLSDAVGLALFTGMGVFMSVVADLYRRARQPGGAESLALWPNAREVPTRWSRQGLLLNAGLAASLAIMAGAGWQSARNLQALAKADEMETRSRLIILELDRLISTLKDAETGQRGYLLTGEEKYLELYRTSIGMVQSKLAKPVDFEQFLSVVHSIESFWLMLVTLPRAAGSSQSTPSDSKD
ncbi:MAG: DUF4118 domain-containing protein [Limisphaerales bacterium]